MPKDVKRIELPKTAAEQQEILRKTADNMPSDAAEALNRMRADAKSLKGVEPTSAPDALPTAATLPSFATTESVVIRIFDGREIELGPPTIPHMLTIAEIFKDDPQTGAVGLEARLRMAKIFQYVRRIDNHVLPGYIGNWPDIAKLAHSLKEYGCRAVYEAYQENWPDYEVTAWQTVRKSSSNPSFNK